MTGRLLTARQVADHLGLSTETVLSWVRQGKLPAFRLPGGAIRFRETDLEAWLHERATGRGAPHTTPDARSYSLTTVRSLPPHTTDEEEHHAR